MPPAVSGEAEEGTATMQVADYNLTALVEEVAREFEPVAVASGKHLVTRVAPARTARGDKALVRQASASTDTTVQ